MIKTYSRLLQYSRRSITSAKISVCALLYERYFLMRLNLYSEQKNRLRVFVMWTLKFSCESNQTPTFRALFIVATLVSPVVRVSRLTLLSCWRVSINMTSVLLSLSFSQSACIHTLMVRIHCSMACTAFTSLRELSGLKEG